MRRFAFNSHFVQYDPKVYDELTQLLLPDSDTKALTATIPQYKMAMKAIWRQQNSRFFSLVVHPGASETISKIALLMLDPKKWNTALQCFKGDLSSMDYVPSYGDVIHAIIGNTWSGNKQDIRLLCNAFLATANQETIADFAHDVQVARMARLAIYSDNLKFAEFLPPDFCSKRGREKDILQTKCDALRFALENPLGVHNVHFLKHGWFKTEHPIVYSSLNAAETLIRAVLTGKLHLKDVQEHIVYFIEAQTFTTPEQAHSSVLLVLFRVHEELDETALCESYRTLTGEGELLHWLLQLNVAHPVDLRVIRKVPNHEVLNLLMGVNKPLP